MTSYTSLGSTYNTYRNPALRINTATNGVSSNGLASSVPKSSGTIPDVSKLSVLSDPAYFCEPSPGTVDAFYQRFPKSRGSNGATINGHVAPTNGAGSGQLSDTGGLVLLASDPDLTCDSSLHAGCGDFTTLALSNGNAAPNGKDVVANSSDEDGERYLPAYELKDGSLERLGRGKRPPTVSKTV